MPDPTEPTVFIVDDDDAVRRALQMLMRSVQLRVETFSSAQEFLDFYRPQQSGCLLLDVRMPRMSGMELHEKLRQMATDLPIIFMTGHADVPMAVQAMQNGAFDFLEKPFRDQDMIDRVHMALDHHRERRERGRRKGAIVRRLETLTNREREIMERIVAGDPNKVIAADLNMSQRTVEIHRGRVMEKMNADSLAHLVRMVMEARQVE